MAFAGSDKRDFPRYILNLDCDAIIEGEKVKARIVDFSINGIGLVVENLPDINTEDFDIIIKEIDVDTRARIISTKDFFSRKKVCIQKIGLLKGSLPLYRISDFIIGLNKLGKTGILQINTDQYTKKIFFIKGEVVFAASNEEKERMGDILVEIGKITRDQYDDASELMMRSGIRHGAALVELGHLTPEDLVWAVRHQVEKIIQNLFNLNNGKTIFIEEQNPIDEMITLKLSIGNLIYRGIKSIENLEVVKKYCPSLDSPLYFSTEPLELFQDIILEKNEKDILELIRDERTLKDIVSMSPLSESETIKTVYALYSTRMIKETKSVIDPDAIKEIIGQPEAETDAEFLERVEKLYTDHKTLGYYDALNIGRDASTDEIKRAYYTMAREYHPDRHLQFQSDEVREKLNTVFEYINEAYSALMNQEQVLEASVESEESETVDQEQVLEASAESEELKTFDKEDVLETLTEKEQTSTEDSHKEEARMKFAEGKQVMKTEDCAQALSIFEQVVQLDDSVAEYHYNYGLCLFKNTRLKDAEKSIRKALELDPQNAEYTAERGRVYLKLGLKTKAKKSFETALKNDPSNATAREGLEVLDS
jgi:Flp pilus assembly protein TadD